MTISVLPDRRVDTRTLIPESNERMKSGNREADYILGGGFPINSINIVMGHPGSGKTIFAEQLIFDNAGEDRPIIYLTTLSEPLAKVVRYLQGFSFFDESKLGSQVVYEDIGERLATEGPSALIPVLQEMIKSIAPKIIVIDSFNFDAPKTANILALTARLDVADKKVLILTDGVKQNVFLSGRNLPNVHVMPFTDSSTYHILWSDVVIVESAALSRAAESERAETTDTAEG